MAPTFPVVALVALGSVALLRPSAGSVATGDVAESCDAAFLQVQRGHQEDGAVQFDEGAGRESCAPLTNAGTHFTVDVEVGTPGQKFSVVADTGSNALIVPSCLCQSRGHCSSSIRCFTGTDKSSSFHLFVSKATQKPMQEVLSFGSGKIAGVVVQDQVQVGSLSTTMEDGLILMVDQALNFHTDHFEGILGLGPPMAKEEELARARQEEKQQQEKEAAQQAEQGMETPEQADEQQPAAPAVPKHVRMNSRALAERTADDSQGLSSTAVGTASIETAKDEFKPDSEAATKYFSAETREQRSISRTTPRTTSFLEQAGVPRFSMCFNDGKEGVLRLGGAKKEDAMDSVGMFHWGVDLRGISVGDGSAMQKLTVCSPDNMEEGQETACGMLPDSGTTLLLGPEDQVVQLLDTICEKWERCSTNATAMQQAYPEEAISKAAIAKALLQDCTKWMGTSEGGLAELPPVQFHVAGGGADRDATPKVLELSPVDYIVSYVDPEDHTKVAACNAAFGPLSFNTQKNGPVWIMGMPLFFAYTVSYDVESRPPTVGFTSAKESPCGSCDKGVELLGASAGISAEGTMRAKLAHSPRQVWGPPRMPTLAYDAF